MLLCLLSFTVWVSGCGKPALQEDLPTTQAETTVPVESSVETTILEPEEIVFPYFTKKQILADYNYMFRMMDRSYPHFGTVQREYGIERDEVYNEFRERIENLEEPILLDEVVALFGETLTAFGGTGHLWVWFPVQFDALRDAFALMMGSDSDAYKLISTEQVSQTYDWLKDHMNEEERACQKSIIPDTSEENITFERIDDKTAYLRIQTFMPPTRGRDCVYLLNLYAEIADCENLIIDIQNNGGGDPYYWMENIIAPNISEPLTKTEYCLFNRKVYADGFRAEHNKSSVAYKTIAALPEMTEEVLSEFDSAWMMDITVEPDGEEKAFDGRIYLLVDQSVYSAADGFASYAKSTGFATLVGENTGGDGAGTLMNMPISLPNTGLIFWFSTMYPLNGDGSSNTPYGTPPDYYMNEGETALEACLRIIG